MHMNFKRLRFNDESNYYHYKPKFKSEVIDLKVQSNPKDN